MAVTAHTSRAVNRGANPYAPMIQQANQQLTPQTQNSVYQSVGQRAQPGTNHNTIRNGIRKLAARMSNKKFSQRDFGELVLVPIHLLDINIDIQRDVEYEHQGNIIELFDPRISLVVMATRLSNGRYSVWEGQQTSCVLYHLHQAGLLEDDFLVQVKCFDENFKVPGSNLTGEAVANYGFRQINGKRLPIDAFHMHRSRVNGVRLYNSNLAEDTQSHELQLILEQNNMFPAKASSAKGNKATPGMVTYIHGINLIGGHGLDKKKFNLAKKDLDWALNWHNRYFSSEKGVDGGFILAFGRLANEARSSNITLDKHVEEDLYDLFKSKYGSPKGFHNDCKQRLNNFQKKNNLKETWSDSCLTPVLVMDYIMWGGKCSLPQVHGMVLYAGI
jgi:hypothetical protein